MDGQGVAIDRLISSHIRSIGTPGPTYNIRSKISAALNALKFASNTLDLKFKYSATEHLTALRWFSWHCHGVSASLKTYLKLAGIDMDEKHNFNWKHLFKYSADRMYLDTILSFCICLLVRPREIIAILKTLKIHFFKNVFHDKWFIILDQFENRSCRYWYKGTESVEESK